MAHAESHTALGALQQMEEESLLRDFAAYVKRQCDAYRQEEAQGNAAVHKIKQLLGLTISSA